MTDFIKNNPNLLNSEMLKEIFSLVDFSKPEINQVIDNILLEIKDDNIIITNRGKEYILQKKLTSDIDIFHNYIQDIKGRYSELIIFNIPDTFNFESVYDFITKGHCKFDYDLFILESYLGYKIFLDYLIVSSFDSFDYNKFLSLPDQIKDELYVHVPYHMIPSDKNISYKVWMDSNIKYFKKTHQLTKNKLISYKNFGVNTSLDIYDSLYLTIDKYYYIFTLIHEKKHNLRLIVDDNHTTVQWYDYNMNDYRHISNNLLSNNSTIPHGLQKKWTINKSLEYIHDYDNGKLNGYQSEFYENGNVRNIKKYNHGILDGLYLEYYNDGVKMSESYHNSGKLVGFKKEWFRNKILSTETEYENGKKNGYEKIYYQNGQLKSLSQWSDGKRMGNLEEWYSDGIKKSKSSYLNDHKHGYFREWHSNGKLKNEKYYHYNNMNGYHKELTKDGQLTTLWYYFNNEPHGECLSWYSNGVVKEKINFKFGKFHGSFKQRDDDGMVRREFYINDKSASPVRRFYELNIKRLFSR